MGRKMNFRIRTQRRSHLAVLLTVTLMVVVFLGYLAYGQRQVAAASDMHAPEAPAAGSSDLLGYYLTQGGYDGASVLTACADGYHMASIWEIMDPSNLKYNTDLGITSDDSGQGPPSGIHAWVRTGYASSADFADPPGTANCNAWISTSSLHCGTNVYLNSEWNNPAEFHVWNVTLGLCNKMFPVWCVADSRGFTVHMPLVVRDN